MANENPTSVRSPNPHGIPNSDVVRPWVNASHLTGRPGGRYIIDFGTMNESDAANYEAPSERLRQVVKPVRDRNRRARRREHWWQLGSEPIENPRLQAIAEAARDIVQKRDLWLPTIDPDDEEQKRRTLTNLYNQRPGWLDLVHARLNEAVLDVYGWPRDLPDAAIIERPSVLNLNREPM